MLLAINYHYIGNEDTYAQGIYPVSIERLERQIKALQSVFTFVGQREMLAVLSGEKFLPKYAAIMTFDDGFRGQYDLALPLLRKHGIPAIFFVSGLPYEERRVLSVHKIHWCRAQLSPKKFLSIIAEEYLYLTGSIFSLDSLGVSDALIRSQYLYDDIDEARLKFLLNKSSLPITIRDAIINRMFNALVPNEAVFCEQMYIPREGLRELLHLESLGVHGYSHVPMASLDDAMLRMEITKTRDVVAAIAGSDAHEIQGISYPFGAPDLVSQLCAAVAEDEGFKFGFTMERACNTSLQSPLLLGRMDANDVPEGKAPLFELDSGRMNILNNCMTAERRIVIQERVSVACM
ncbi:MAG: polysaccharide deacetylase [Parcubacteria group bacterium Gr01-1014_48]|nr:MAG: polysaccharide deacetylase [Parcubacteria group bacterium Greene0416_14]TSC74447.1 MAG: polysaccharide deacetylase [Parcubacteria group bacterium Gr01-1014_48]TSD01757.1 MAG: polysaccharide deacetylase [Parcubacteria group bacterium Greene1014_15]TSD08471.1 MAG: polysaccharide deacetylase [Parcubacteria group bacterium Greene0714_4]